MKIRNKLAKRNLIFNVGAVITAISMTAYSAAAPDYERIKKDINIMIGIVKSSFEDSNDCRRCRVKVTGHYLADQGVVFNVVPSGGYARGYKYVYSSPNLDTVVVDEMPVIPDIPEMPELPEMVQDILADVRGSIEDEVYDWHWDEEGWGGHNSEFRNEQRKLRSELRELSRQMREIEIEEIHANEDELAELEAREQEIEERIRKAEQRRAEVQERFETYTNKRSQEREAKRTRQLAERTKQFEKMESIVLNTFCDYSGTMRSLPNDERVSIIVSKGNDESNIYVFEQSELSSCDSAKTDIRKNALSYVF